MSGVYIGECETIEEAEALVEQDRDGREDQLATYGGCDDEHDQ
jgi:hypothetical protein